MKFTEINFKRIIFIMFIILATALISIFIYELLNNFEINNFSNYSTSTNNYINNNPSQVVRSIENSTSTISSTTSNNSSFPEPTNTIGSPVTKAVVIIASIVGGTFALFCGIVVCKSYGWIKSSPPANAQAIIDAGAEEFLNQ